MTWKKGLERRRKRGYGVNGTFEKRVGCVFKAGSARKEWRVRASSDGNEREEAKSSQTPTGITDYIILGKIHS
jgi:hypothetical protein